MKPLAPRDNKFHIGNGDDGKHYWLTPSDMLVRLNAQYSFDFDPCPYPLPEGFDGLTCEWGQSNYVNPPFGSILHQGPQDKKPKKKGMTAWVRKAIEEHKKGKRVVMVYPLDKWVLMLLAAGARVYNEGDVRWLATEDGSSGNGTGRHIARFVLEPATQPAQTHPAPVQPVSMEEILTAMKAYREADNGCAGYADVDGMRAALESFLDNRSKT